MMMRRCRGAMVMSLSETAKRSRFGCRCIDVQQDGNIEPLWIFMEGLDKLNFEVGYLVLVLVYYDSTTSSLGIKSLLLLSYHFLILLSHCSSVAVSLLTLTVALFFCHCHTNRLLPSHYFLCYFLKRQIHGEAPYEKYIQCGKKNTYIYKYILYTILYVLSMNHLNLNCWFI